MAKKKKDDRVMDDIIRTHTANILQEFVEKGGKGIRLGLYMAFVDVLQWNQEQERQRKEESVKKGN